MTATTVWVVPKSMPNRMRAVYRVNRRPVRVSGETRGPSEGFPDAGTIVVARDFPAAQKREVGGQNLDVEEEESAVAEPVNAGGKRHLGRSAHAMEHRFAGEESAHGDAVEPSGEPRFLPDLDAVRPPEAVQLRIRVEDVGRDPGSFPRPIRARPHDVVERLVE